MRWRVYLAMNINVLSLPLISSIVIGLDNPDLDSIHLDGLSTDSNPAILTEDPASNGLTTITSDLSSGDLFDLASSANQSPRGQASSSGSTCSVDHHKNLQAMYLDNGLQLQQGAGSGGACQAPEEGKSPSKASPQQNNIVNFDESIPIRQDDDDYEDACPYEVFHGRQKVVCDSGKTEDKEPGELFTDGSQDYTLWFVKRIEGLLSTYNHVE